MRTNTSTAVTRLLLRTMVALCVIGGTLSATQAPAVACSCIAQPAETMLDTHDGAFIGSLLGQTATEDAATDWSDTIYTFEVTEWIKGDRSPGPFDVRSAGNGAACGFEVQPGQEVAVYVTVDRGVATGGLCSTTNAADLTGTVKVPTVSDGPGTYVATGWRQPVRILANDGGLVAVQPDPPEGQAGAHHALCDGAVMAEVRDREIAVVDLTTFQDVERIPFNRETHQLLCAGDRLLAVAGPEAGQRVYDARTDEVLSSPLARFIPATLLDDTLVYLAQEDDDYAQGWRALDLATGNERLIVEMLSGDERIESVDFSPDGTTIALSLAEGNQPVLDVVLVNVADGSLTTRTVGTHGASVAWLDDEQLLVRSYSGGFEDTDNTLIASRSDLSTITEFDSELNWPSHVEGETLVGIEQGRVQAMPLAGGPIDVLAEVPDAYNLLRLSEPVDVIADARPVGSGPVWTIPIPSAVIEALPVGAIFAEQVDDADNEDDEPAEPVEASDDLIDTTDEEQPSTVPLATDADTDDRTFPVTTVAVVLASMLLAALGTVWFARRRSS